MITKGNNKRYNKKKTLKMRNKNNQKQLKGKSKPSKTGRGKMNKKGGHLLLVKYPSLGIAEPTILFETRISDQNFCNFKRFLNSPMDCFVNAMQIMGMLNTNAANLLRISCVGVSGFSQEQIASIFILYTNFFFLFREMAGWDAFGQQIMKISPGYVTLGGYHKNGTGHVFLIGKTTQNKMIYIDPQIQNNTLCFLHEAQCENLIKNMDKYYLLYRNDIQLTPQQRMGLGFVNVDTFQQVCSLTQSTYQVSPPSIAPNPVNILAQLQTTQQYSPLTTQDVADGVSEPMEIELMEHEPIDLE